MIQTIDKTKEVILKIAEEYGLNEEDFKRMLKRKKLNGPFDPAKWSSYIDALTGLPTCILCDGPQVLEQGLAGKFRSPRGMRCKYHRDHFFAVQFTIPEIMVRKDIPLGPAVEWWKANAKEVVLDAMGDSRIKEQCIEKDGRYFPKPGTEYPGCSDLPG
jgi:hypothetical protein